MAFPGIQPKSTEDRIRATVAHAARLAQDGQPVELEIRFGRIRGRTFEPGFSPDVVDRIETLLETFNNWTESEPGWFQSHVFYHGSSIPGDKRELRTEKVYRSTTREDIECVEKRSAEKLDCAVALLDGPPLTPDGDTPPIDFRISVAIEHPVPKDDIPMTVHTDQCVLKKRREFLYTPVDRRTPVWAFHITKRWSAPTLVQALYLSARDPPQCDIELELLDTRYLLEHGVEFTAFKMIWKIYDVIQAVLGANLHHEEFAIHIARH
jgi:hypothetical protein